MAQYRKLLGLLDKEYTHQEQLQGLLAQERTAIVSLNREEIEKLHEAKRKLLHAIAGVEVERAKVLEQFCDKETEESSEPLKLSDIAEKCPDKVLGRVLIHTGAKLRQTAENVRGMNEHNGVLLKQSLGLIASTLAIMRSAPDTSLPTYGAGGALMSDTEDPAFARRSQQLSREA